MEAEEDEKSCEDFSGVLIPGNASVETCVDMPVKIETLEWLSKDALDFALMNGAGMRQTESFREDCLTVMPFTLFPSTFPRGEFEKACEMQKALNELVFRAAHDHAFLSECLENTIRVDPFTARLFEIYTKVREEGIVQPISAALVRSDVMLERCCSRNLDMKCSSGSFCCGNAGCCPRPFCCWRQVEINTIATGFGWLSQVAGNIHRFVLSSIGDSGKLKQLPENPSLQELNAGLVKAWELYGKKQAALLFVIDAVTYNICDQRFMQFEIKRQNPDIRVLRSTLAEISRKGRLTPDREFLLDEQEVGLVYFRTAYGPDLYLSEADWEARLMIERSRAIKCPSIQVQLAGTKKEYCFLHIYQLIGVWNLCKNLFLDICTQVQQVLGKAAALKRFIKNSKDQEGIKGICAGLYSLDLSTEGDKMAEIAMKHPNAFVMKPQREGGGHNLYGKEIKETLQKLGNSQERSMYILMDRIFPPTQKNYIVRPKLDGPPELVDVISELGIFGVIIGSNDRIIYNRQAGHALRTKLARSDEGGVAIGVGALDSPFLVDIN